MTSNQVDYKKEYTDENITSFSILDLTSSTEAIETKNVNLNDLYHLDQNTSSLKPLIENYILNYYFKYLKRIMASEDNPFDEVYLSKLVPDEISTDDIISIKSFINIQDLSDQISFDDGLD